MASGVLYLLHGTKLAARLVVSAASLRRYHKGAIAVVTTDSASTELVRLIANDVRLRIDHIPVRPALLPGCNTGYLLKTRVNEFTPFDTTVFLDCDTLVTGDISRLFDLPSSQHVIVTQFAEWGTKRGIVARRIRRWSSIAPSLVPEALTYGRAVNTGVFSFARESQVFERWHQLAHSGRHLFIPDEVSMQLLLPHVPAVMLDARYNCSARFGTPNDPDTRIVHYHGRKHVGRYGSRWLTNYLQAVAENLGGVAEWTPAKDRRLRGYLQSIQGRGEACT